MSRSRPFVVGLFVVAAASSGCTVAVTEAQLRDRTQALLVAQKVSTSQNNGAHVKRIALIGLSTPNQIHDSSGDFHIGGSVGAVVDGINAAKQMGDRAAALACRALEASHEELTKALVAEGFELVSADEKLALAKYSALTQGGSPEMCYASRAPARLNIVDVFNWKKSFIVHRELIEELGVDGILMAQVGADDLKTGEGNLTLYVKGKQEYAVVGWMGRVKKGKFKFEPVDPKITDASLPNATRVFVNSLRLLAMKMGAEAK